MTDIPEHWQAYARLQQQLANSHRVDSRAWGREAGLHYLLQPSPDLTQLDSTLASAARKHRHRVACLKRMHAEISDAILQDPRNAGRENPDLIALEVREVTQVIASHVTPRDWNVLTSLAAGEEYAEVAKRHRTSSGALRVRVSRLRAKLVLLAA